MKCSCNQFTKWINYTKFDGDNYKITCHKGGGKEVYALFDQCYISNKILSNIFIWEPFHTILQGQFLKLSSDALDIGQKGWK